MAKISNKMKLHIMKKLYENRFSMQEIADYFGVKKTVVRTAVKYVNRPKITQRLIKELK